MWLKGTGRANKAQRRKQRDNEVKGGTQNVRSVRGYARPMGGAASRNFEAFRGHGYSGAWQEHGISAACHRSAPGNPRRAKLAGHKRRRRGVFEDEVIRGRWADENENVLADCNSSGILHRILVFIRPSAHDYQLSSPELNSLKARKTSR